MTVHRFAINIPNPTPGPVRPRLRLERVKRGELKGLGLELPRAELKVSRAIIARDPCQEEGKEALTLRLKPYESVDVYVVIDTGPPPPRGGVAAFNLIDQRARGWTGGVMVACVDPRLVEPPGQLITVKRPCPAVLADLYGVLPDQDPSSPPAPGRLPAAAEVDLVAAITNPQARALQEVQIYLEHLGSSGTHFVPATWSAGTLNSGDVFYASWRMRPPPAPAAVVPATIVVDSAGANPVRVTGTVAVAEERKRRRRR